MPGTYDTSLDRGCDEREKLVVGNRLLFLVNLVFVLATTAAIIPLAFHHSLLFPIYISLNRIATRKYTRYCHYIIDIVSLGSGCMC